MKINKCPICSNQMIFLNHKFRPPKKTEKKKWELVKFLIFNGFPFQHIYKNGKSDCFKTEADNYVAYPKNLHEAKEFVIKYKDQKIKTNHSKELS
ncbi:hypothetical protein [Aureivirga sp. CE67]|uniref:hypothetical protein n=1 Tax=Aureivirga sp. CE67 TaxID=1788983 RepID=UPI0018C979A8|nr:hypothetical protein [Aureivirga sp. CE67]